MESRFRATIVVPVFNEEQQLLKGKENGFHDSLRKWADADPGNRHVVFVDDGSTDRTRQVLEDLKFESISSDPESHLNKGKAHAVWEGFKHAKLHHNKPDVLVMLDADLTNVTPKRIDELIKPLLPGGIPGRHRLPDMAVGSVTEENAGFAGDSFPISGQRAIRYSVIAPMLHPKNEGFYKKALSGYGLEAGLNHFIPDSVIADTFFRCERPLRHISYLGQLRQITRASRAASKDVAFTKRVKLLRRLASKLPSKLRTKAYGFISNKIATRKLERTK